MRATSHMLLALLMAAAIMLPGASQADGAEADGKITAIHLVEEANWPPFTPNKSGDTREGLSYELMQAIFSRLHVDIDLELVPQKRMLSYLESGQKDAATLISINAERSLTIDFSEPIFQKREFVYFLADRKPPFEWSGFQSLQGLKIGITAGHNYSDEFLEAAARLHLTVEKVNTEGQNFKKLLSRRIDVLLCNEAPANELLGLPEYNGKIIPAAKPYFTKDYSIGFSKKSPARNLIPEVNATIKKMREDGSIQAILSKYIK